MAVHGQGELSADLLNEIALTFFISSLEFFDLDGNVKSLLKKVLIALLQSQFFEAKIFIDVKIKDNRKGDGK
jgi:hypothetical protein